MTTTYTSAELNKWVAALDDAGIDTEHYHGRFYWHGPAARTDESGWPTLQDVIEASGGVRVQWDNLGLDWIVYPKTSEPGWGECPGGDTAFGHDPILDRDVE